MDANVIDRDFKGNPSQIMNYILDRTAEVKGAMHKYNYGVTSATVFEIDAEMLERAYEMGYDSNDLNHSCPKPYLSQPCPAEGTVLNGSTCEECWLKELGLYA